MKIFLKILLLLITFNVFNCKFYLVKEDEFVECFNEKIAVANYRILFKYKEVIIMNYNLRPIIKKWYEEKH